MEHGVDLAGHQHVLAILVVAHARQLEARRRLEVDVLVELGDPFDGRVRNAVFLLEDAAQPQDRGDLIGLHGDPLADQVLGPVDALRGVDEGEAVAEAAVQEHRDRVERHVLVAGDDVGRARNLGDVELAIAQEPPVPRGGIGRGDHRQLDAVGLHGAFLQRANDLVVATAERELHLVRHSLRFPSVCVRSGIGMRRGRRVKPAGICARQARPAGARRWPQARRRSAPCR